MHKARSNCNCSQQNKHGKFFARIFAKHLPMQDFVLLYQALDESTRTLEKTQALQAYFEKAGPEDCTWAIALLSGRRPRRPVKSGLIREAAVEAADIPAWLFQESFDAVGDMGETIALLTQQLENSEPKALHAWMEEIQALSALPDTQQKEEIKAYWKQLNRQERFLLNKLLGGSFRVGVSENLVLRAIARVSGLDEQTVAHRLMGKWTPGLEAYRMIFSPDEGQADHSKPYPFYLASALDISLPELGPVQEWQAEWKWDGIRAQLIKRKGEVFIWSRGEELITASYPELSAALQLLPDHTVLDGELLACQEGKPMPFSVLQKRLGRKSPGKKLLQEAPVSVFCYDLLECEGNDWRGKPLEERRERLEQLLASLAHPQLQLSGTLKSESWEQLAAEREKSRSMEAEGLMLKRKSSVYKSGRKRGDWWKWKTEPFTCDAVLVYAQRGTGRRASLYTDYTFALRNDEGQWLPVAKAYSGLSDEEIKEVDHFVRSNTLDKFGPVRTVKAELVFELAFEGISLSKRHKSGIAVRFPRIKRWRKDKKAEEADTLESVKKLISP